MSGVFSRNIATQPQGIDSNKPSSLSGAGESKANAGTVEQVLDKRRAQAMFIFPPVIKFFFLEAMFLERIFGFDWSPGR